MNTKNRYSSAVGYILFIAGSSLSVWLGNAVWQGYDTHTWIEAKAIVYQSNMLEETRRGSEAFYTHQLTYRYQLPEGTYTGHQVYRTDLPLAAENQIRKLITLFPEGSLQSVYVNPNNPKEAVLVKGVSIQLLVAFVFALACFGVGMLSLRSQRS
jgi:hypothetical protein